jgi:hypothetical protein
MKTNMLKIAFAAGAAVAAAVVAAAWLMAFQSVSTQVEAGLQAPAINIDRVDNHPPAANCTHQAWPYYESSCLRNRGEPVGEKRTMRIVPIDRIQTPNPMVTAAK